MARRVHPDALHEDSRALSRAIRRGDMGAAKLIAVRIISRQTANTGKLRLSPEAWAMLNKHMSDRRYSA